MSKIMEQPIVDYIRTSLHTNGFPLPAVVENEEILLFMNKIVISKTQNF